MHRHPSDRPDPQADAQLRAAHALAVGRLSGLLESAMDAIITVDASQRIVIYNQAAQDVFGWRADEVLGQPLVRLMPERFRQQHGHDVDRFGSTGVSSRRMSRSAVVRGLRRDGSEFPVEASISQAGEGADKLYTVILRDISERVRAEQELQAFATEAHRIREGEKTRVARELHDELAQSLTALKMDTQWLRQRFGETAPPEVSHRLGEMAAMLDRTVASTRRIAADLRPLMLDDLGLLPAIEWLSQQFTQRHRIEVALALDESVEPDALQATALFRITQEALANVGKHAAATQVRVSLSRDGDDVVLHIGDDGCGFDTRAPRKPQSLGLMGLRERVQLMGGTLAVDAAPGQGTRITVRARFVPRSDDDHQAKGQGSA